MKVNVQLIHPDAQMPTYGSEGAGCFDLYTIQGGFLNPTEVFRTGLKIEVPIGFVMLIFSRSGMGFKHDVRLSNCVGVIDSDYRGEIMVKLMADGDRKYVDAGARIAQALILPYECVEFTQTDALTETNRGEGGFGSTG